MANLLSFATVNQISTDLGISLMSRHHRRLVLSVPRIDGLIPGGIVPACFVNGITSAAVECWQRVSFTGNASVTASSAA
jgi:hypothetical protein